MSARRRPNPPARAATAKEDRPSGLGNPVIYPDLSFFRLRDAILALLPRDHEFGNQLLNLVLRAADWYEPREEQGLAGWTAMERLEKQLEYHAYAIAQDLSSAEWLWYLRRAAAYFDMPVPPPMVPNSSYTTAIAEAASSLSATGPRPSSTPMPAATYPIDRAAAYSIVRMKAVSVLLHNTQSTLRWVAKGAIVRATGGQVQIQNSKELEELVNNWDRRMQASPDTFLTRAGLYSYDLAAAPDPAVQFAEVPILVWSNHGYEFRLLRLAEIPALLDPAFPAALRWPAPLLDLIALLWSPVLDWLHKGLRETADIQRCGYWITRREVVIGELAAAAEVIGALRLRGAIPAEVSFGSPAEMFNRLSSLGGCVWPPALGPAIRDAGEGWVIVDFHAATECLRRALAKPRLDPGQDLAWSTHFEKSIQEALDASAWKPSPLVREYRGRSLRIAGAKVTDVDAIGERDQDLMIVSCKSRPFSETWNRGDNNAVRAVEDRVDQAVEELADRIGKLRRTPHGDNYDFSRYRQIIGAVVFPSVPWTQNPDAWEEVLGLRVASSAGEFAEWIRKV